MAEFPDGWWRDKDTLRAELKKHGGSRRKTADAHGVARSTITDWSKRLGLDERPVRVVPEARTGDVSREEVLEAELREARALLRSQRNADVIEQRMIDTLAEMLPAKEPVYHPVQPELRMTNGYTPHEAMLLWSDLHAAEVVDREQMNGINEYNWTVMLRRHDVMLGAIRSFLKHRPYPVPRLQIAALGDMVTGDIHEELSVTNDRVIMEAAIQLGLDGAEFIESLVPLFERIDVDGVVGNHGRRSKKPQAKNAHDNFDWLVYHIIRLRLAKYPSVTVTVPKAAQHPVKMCEQFACLLFHGDGIRSSMPGVPWGGVARRTRELERQFYPVVGPISHFVCGHFHQDNVTDAARVIVNGSVKGPDEYSIKQFGGGCEARQLLLWFHPERGLTDVSYLDLRTPRA